MPSESETSLQHIHQHLSMASPALAHRYTEVFPVMEQLCNATELQNWAEHCLRLAQSGWRTWESADAFVQQSPWLARHLGLAGLCTWAEQGHILSCHSADVAAAFFRAARPLLQGTSHTVFAAWCAAGQWYLEQRPALSALATEYFTLSPGLYTQYALPAATRWHHLAQACTRVSAQHGRNFFRITRQHQEQSPDVDYTPAWETATQLVPYATEVALAYLERYADFVHRLGTESTARVGTLLQELARPTASEASQFLRLIGSTLGFLTMPERLQVLEWCQHIVAVSHAGVLAFLHHLPELRRLLPGAQLQPWVTTGITTTRTNAEAGQAYFALESATAQDRLHALQKRVVFAHMEPVLQLYTQAILGKHFTLRTTADLPNGLQLAGRDLPTSDGTTIFVPAEIDDFAAATTNFAAYKVVILHQIGFYECGTFQFEVAECGRQVPALQQRLVCSAMPGQGGATAAFEHFFAAFPQPDLARTLFTMLEDTRIDAYLMRQYKGIRRDLAFLMQHSLQQRPSLSPLPLFPALLEGLLQLTLGATLLTDPSSATGSPVLHALLQRLAQPLPSLQTPAATVYDTARAVLHCYLLLSAIRTDASSTFDEVVEAALSELLSQLPEDADSISLADMFRLAGESADSMPILPDSTEPAVGVEPVPYRGDVKPEFIQKKMRLQELTEALQSLQNAVNPLPPDVLKQLLEQGNVDIKSLEIRDLTATSGLFVSDLEGREGGQQDAVAAPAALQETIAALQAELQGELSLPVVPKERFLYDEWDYVIHDYRRHWCQLEETVLDDEGTSFVTDTRQRHAELLAQVSRQFQLLKPEMFQKIKRLADGEDIDLDSAIEALVDQRATRTPPEKVYMRRHKRDRSVAAAFLLDMSASTDDEVKESENSKANPQPEPQKTRRYDFSGFVQADDYLSLPARSPQPDQPRRRIIDIEKEAVVLMAEALEGLGDAYAVYGFSGYGRDQVDFFVVKEFAEPYDARIQGRIGAVKPHRSTRMGAAIRHAVRKLGRQDARLKTLLMLSDGYPQDFDYGKDRKSKEYGLQDTMMALHEARLKGIQTFCITVDPAGHDYLRAMCPDQQYLVIENIAALPNELPKVYRGLTT